MEGVAVELSSEDSSRTGVGASIRKLQGYYRKKVGAKQVKKATMLVA